MKYFTRHPIQQGFTLIELAMVLLILSLLLSSFLAPLAARVEQRQRNNTQVQLDEIKEVIYGFVLQNKRLPCPDCRDPDHDDDDDVCAPFTADDGEEDREPASEPPEDTDTDCFVEFGNLPWADLGIKGTDDWGNKFTYGVTGDFADDPGGLNGTGTGCTPVTEGVSFSLCSEGDIEVVDADGGKVAGDIPAIVVSHGKNLANDPASADERANTDDDAVFVDKDYSQKDGSEFDDMLMWISPYALRTLVVKSEILP